MNVLDIYHRLLEHHSPREWWPVDHDFRPREFEIVTGAILTQNTNWKNVEKALNRLEHSGLVSPEAVAEAGIEALEKAVMPSGFYRQKAGRLRSFSAFIISFGSFAGFKEKATRSELLSQKGVGPETADSILLYALGKRSFVIDAYTRRVFTRLGFRDFGSYEEWRRFFETEATEDIALYRKFHALIVEHAKDFCRAKPLCGKCPLGEICARKI